MTIGGASFTKKPSSPVATISQLSSEHKTQHGGLFKSLRPSNLMSSFSDILDRIWIGALKILSTEHFDTTARIGQIKGDAYARLIATLNDHQVDCRAEEQGWMTRGAGEMLREKLGPDFQFEFTDQVKAKISDILRDLAPVAARNKLDRALEENTDPKLLDSRTLKVITEGDLAFIDDHIRNESNRALTGSALDQAICEAYDRILEARLAVHSSLKRCPGDWGIDDERTIKVALLILQNPLSEKPAVRKLQIKQFASLFD